MSTARIICVAALLLVAGAVAGCSGAAQSAPTTPPGKLPVVAAENFWGSIAAQLGGARVSVRSIAASPGTDPHSYEPTAADAVTLARARLAIVNGIGYDPWASKLLAADGSSGAAVLDVGRVLGLGDGDNPHQWYAPSSVQRVVGRIVADYKRLDPAGAAYYDQRRSIFETHDLAEYDRLRSEIRARYANVAVGYSESIFAPLGRDLGLRLMTPGGFARAITEGTDVSAQDKQTVDRQAETRAIRVWIYNSQNATPDVQRVNRLARAAHVPITTISETPSPASATFEQWQSAQLRRLMAALHEATGR